MGVQSMKVYRVGVILALMLIICCTGENMTEDKIIIHSFAEVSPSSWDTLAQRKIFFGHQSVGENIIQGITELMNEHNEMKLDITKTKNLANFPEGVFAHFPIGINNDPGAKIEDFNRIMRSGIGELADIAFFKFCFVDITSSTDVRKVFDDYARTMASLRTTYPDVAFVHMTVPLLRKEKGSPKMWLRRILGKGDGFFANEHNVRRNEFNDLIRSAYEKKEPVFDLAGIESTYLDGSRETFTQGGRTYFSLVPEYTEDGGHLNGKGMRSVAEQFLIFLSGIQ